MNLSPIAAMKPRQLEVSFNSRGLKVLVVDNNTVSRVVISKILQLCRYQVTQCKQPTEALKVLRKGEIKFDMVITEVNFYPDMTGLEFLQIVQHETELPVVVVSAEDGPHVMMEYVRKGACAYLLKPVKTDDVRFLWQVVARKKMLGFKQIDNVEKSEPNSGNSGEEKEYCGSLDGVPTEGEQNKVRGKKHRLVWTDELHHKFVDAVKQLGIQNAVPKKVLELMNVPGLTRGNVSSHLQKFRLNIKKIAGLTGVIPPWMGHSLIEHKGLRLRTPSGMKRN